jgi:hypothetical protein
MIQANHLRLGNFIKHKGKAEALQRLEVIELKKAGIIITKDLLGFNFGIIEDDAAGILLTPELLGMAGFRETWKSETQTNFLKPQIELFLLHKEGKLIYKRGLMAYTCLSDLHQLQNLHFALTGEELPINF